ncbi:MAG: ABC-type Zn uptake system ZnuABC Zn-binding protein ZnuA [Rhodothermales bacterium]|jgi:ABC-type Zn uptake system ZnuABC Zn-binding protein ZnuA
MRRPLARLVFLAILLAGCSSPEGPRARVVVTIPPLKLLAEQLLDSGTAVTTLLPGGVSPHAYDPLPSAVRTVASSQVLLAIHPDVDGWVTALQADRIWWLTDESDDPHSWLDPIYVRDALPRLSEVLCQVYDRQCPAIQQRASALAVELDSLTMKATPALSGLRLVPSGVFLSAFSARFHLQPEAVIAPVEGVEPSPRDVARSIDAARSAGLVVGQAGFPELAATEVAQASGARFVRIDPLGTRPPATTYADLLDEIIRTLTQ